MKKSIKKKWIEALRSDKYKKCKHRLHSPRSKHAFCVIGVLCDLYAKERGATWVKRDGGSFILNTAIALPNEVKKWAGIEDGNLYVKHNDKTQQLISLNDDTNLSFKSLSNLIEEQL